MKNENCLVIGGCGFLGSSIVSLLLERGYDVTVLDDLSTGNLKLLDGKKVEFIKRDITDPDLLKVLPKRRFKFIFNFGSASTDRAFSLNGVAAIRTIVGMLNTLKIGIDTGAEKVVYPSSGTVYGNCRAPQREEDNPKPLTMYASTKGYLESVARINEREIPSVGLRIFTGYGGRERFKGSAASVVTLFYNEIVNGRAPIVFGDGEQRRDYVHSSNVAEIAVNAAESRVTGILNAGSGLSHSSIELIDILNEKLGVNIKPKFIKSPLTHVAETMADLGLVRQVFRYNPLDLRDGLDLFLREITTFQ